MVAEGFRGRFACRRRGVALWNLYQELEINNLRAQQRGAESAHESRNETMREQVWRLEDRLERLLVVTDAMWELLSERLGVSEAELSARAAQIDTRNGDAMDGRRARVRLRCDECAAVVPHGRPNCLFCGAPINANVSALDQV